MWHRELPHPLFTFPHKFFPAKKSEKFWVTIWRNQAWLSLCRWEPMLAHKFGEGEKKEILVSVLLDLRDGAFSFTTELSNSNVPSCVLQIWTLAQKWLTWSHFQGKMLTFWLHASQQGYQIVRGLNFWTPGASLSFPKLILLLILPNHPFVSFQFLRGVTELKAHTHLQCGGVWQCKNIDKLCPTRDDVLQAPSTGFLR